MSRIHTVLADADDVARLFAAEARPGIVTQTEIVEGTTGLVVHQVGGCRVLRPMRWGFPRHTQAMRDRGEPPTPLGLVADLTNPMWENHVVGPRYRCVIVLTHFANPDGPAGAKTRTWFSVRDLPVVAWAGFCRNTPEWGPVYAGMTMTANAAIPPTNDRMPVLLEPADHDRWLHGSIEDVIGLQFGEPFAAERMLVERTTDPWRSGRLPGRLTRSRACCDARAGRRRPCATCSR